MLRDISKRRKEGNYKATVARKVHVKSYATIGAVDVQVVLIPHKHALPVGLVEESQSHRVVARAPRIAAHVLQRLHAVRLQVVRDGHPEPGEVLVVAEALHFQRPPVQEKPYTVTSR